MNQTSTVPASTIKKVAELVTKCESITLVGMPGCGTTGFCTDIANKSHLQNLCSSEFLKDLITVYYDAESGEDFFEMHLQGILSEYSAQTNIIAQVSEVLKKEKRLLILIENFTFDFKNLGKFIVLIRNLNPKKISFVVSMYESEFNKPISPENLFLKPLFHNIIRLNYYDEKDAKEWVQRIANKLDIKIDQNVTRKILEFSGGVARFIKNAVRAYGQNTDIDAALASAEVKNIVKTLWERLTIEEKNAIISVYTKSDTTDYAKEIEYMKAHNFLNPDGTFRGKWLSLILEDINKVKNLKLEKNKIFCGEIEITNQLTNAEFKIVEKLLKSKEKFISRDDVAGALWSSERLNISSDWAIDKAISRLRYKFEHLGLGQDSIRTLKGKGFQLKS